MAVPIGLFFGRVANFINSELWGHPTTVAWAMVFPNGGPSPRHPSQLYEAALEGLVLFALLAVLAARFGLLRRKQLSEPCVGFLRGNVGKCLQRFSRNFWPAHMIQWPNNASQVIPSPLSVFLRCGFNSA